MTSNLTEVKLLANVKHYKSNALCNIVTYYNIDKSNGVMNTLLLRHQ